MEKIPFPQNSLTKKQISKINTPTLQEDSEKGFASDALLMNECYLQGRNFFEEGMSMSEVSNAKHWVDENQK